jgi:hypothetical protein
MKIFLFQWLSGQRLLITDASRSSWDTSHKVGLLWTGDQSDREDSTCSHSDTSHSVGLLWTGDQPDTEDCTCSHWHTTLCRSPLNGWSARHRGLCPSIHNTQETETYMPSGGFEPTVPPSERPQTHALDSAATGIGKSENTFSFLTQWNVSIRHVFDLLFCVRKNQASVPLLLP